MQLYNRWNKVSHSSPTAATQTRQTCFETSIYFLAAVALTPLDQTSGVKVSIEKLYKEKSRLFHRITRRFIAQTIVLHGIDNLTLLAAGSLNRC